VNRPSKHSLMMTGLQKSDNGKGSHDYRYEDSSYEAIVSEAEAEAIRLCPYVVKFQSLSVITKDGKILIDKATIALVEGSIAAIVGHSGSGKSLAVETMLGIVDSGLKATGTLLCGYTNREISLQNTSCIYNYWKRNPCLTSCVNRDYFPPYMKIHETLRFSFPIYITTYDVQKLFSILWDYVVFESRGSALSSTEILDSYFKKLSIGEKRMISAISCICSILYSSNAGGVIFMDEPTSSINNLVAYRLLEVLKQCLALCPKWSVLIILHQPGKDIIKYLDKVYIMDKGSLLEGDVTPYLGYNGGVHSDGYCDVCDCECVEVVENTWNYSWAQKLELHVTICSVPWTCQKKISLKEMIRLFLNDTIAWWKTIIRDTGTVVPTIFIAPIILSIIFFFAFIKLNQGIKNIGELYDVMPASWVESVSVNVIQEVTRQESILQGSYGEKNTWLNVIVSGTIGIRKGLNDILILPSTLNNETSDLGGCDNKNKMKLISSSTTTTRKTVSDDFIVCITSLYQFEDRYFTEKCRDCPSHWNSEDIGYNYLFKELSTDNGETIKSSLSKEKNNGDYSYVNDTLVRDFFTVAYLLDSIIYGNRSAFGQLEFGNHPISYVLYDICDVKDPWRYWACMFFHLNDISDILDPLLSCTIEKPLITSVRDLEMDYPVSLGVAPNQYELTIDGVTHLMTVLKKLLLSAFSCLSFATCIFLTPCVIGFIAYFSMCVLYPTVPFVNMIRASGARTTSNLIASEFISLFICYLPLSVLYLCFVVIPIMPPLTSTYLSPKGFLVPGSVGYYCITMLIQILCFMIMLIPYALFCVVGTIAGLTTSFSQSLIIYLMPLMLSVMFEGFFVREYDLDEFLTAFSWMTWYRWPFFGFLRTCLPEDYMFGTVPSGLAAGAAGLPSWIPSGYLCCVITLGLGIVILGGTCLVSRRRKAKMKGFYEGSYT